MNSVLLLLISIFAIAQSTFLAGVAKVNGTLPMGTPLAGFNWGPRRVPYWPIPIFRQYTTFMEPSVGIIDPTWVKAVVIDNGSERLAFLTLDAIGADGTVCNLGHAAALKMGFSVPREKLICSASHTHSGPGAISPEFLWEIAPAVDLLVPELQNMFAQYIGEALVTAEKSLQPAKMDIGSGDLIGVTKNRRAPNPWVQPGTIDPHLGVIRIDTAAGEPIATIWNFAMHGTCYGAGNMKFCSDIAGASCDAIESTVGGIALFINGDAGDIDPTDTTCGCSQGVCTFPGAKNISSAVATLRASLNPTDTVVMNSSSQIVAFGETQLNLTLARLDNCTQGGPIDICSICDVLDCDANIKLDDGWLEENPRFSAFSFLINGISTVLVTMPGEALVELGWWIRNDTQDLGYDQTLLCGYSNNHMGYFATPNEYDYGGYESELTFWGVHTASMVRAGCYGVASQVNPKPVVAVEALEPVVRLRRKTL